MKFTNYTTLTAYAIAKSYYNFAFRSVPDTAAGFDSCRKIVTIGDHEYKIGCNTERDFWLSYDPKNLFVNFRIEENDTIEIISASENGKHYKTDRFLKKYTTLICTIASMIKFDDVLRFKPYTTEIANALKEAYRD